MKHILGIAKSNVDLSGAKASKLELDTCALSIKRGAVCDLVKMAKSSVVCQSAFEGQILALYFLTYVVKPLSEGYKLIR